MKLRGMVPRKVACVARKFVRWMEGDIKVLKIRRRKFIATDGCKQAKVPHGVHPDALSDAIKRMRAERTPRETPVRQPVRARPPRLIQRIVVAA